MKIALITGASRGIGNATAQLLAQQGMRVVVNYLRDKQAAQAVVDTINIAGGTAMAWQADVSDERQVVDMFTAIDDTWGPVAVLVNNAGILSTQCRVEDLTAERINRVLTTNVTGYFLCCREAVKRMSHQHGGAGGRLLTSRRRLPGLARRGSTWIMPRLKGRWIH